MVKVVGAGGRGGGGAAGGLAVGNLVLTIGTAGADILHGDHLFVGIPFSDAIYGMAGNDKIIETGAASFLYGGDGDDT